MSDWPETRRAWNRLKAAWRDYRAITKEAKERRMTLEQLRDEALTERNVALIVRMEKAIRAEVEKTWDTILTGAPCVLAEAALRALTAQD